jgi:hypothetical protein
LSAPPLHLDHAGAARGDDGRYRRHQPESTVLYRTVEAHCGSFREQAEEAGGLPRFVVREVEEYLRCGRLDHGCLRLRRRSLR